jgi:hypothetical protein
VQTYTNCDEPTAWKETALARSRKNHTIDLAGPADPWYITASHRRIGRRRGPIDLPFGVGHIRKVGSNVTACGLNATSWMIFWTTPVDDVENFCLDCDWVRRVEHVREALARNSRG